MTHAQSTARQSPHEILPHPLDRGASIRIPSTRSAYRRTRASLAAAPWPVCRYHGQAGRLRLPRVHGILIDEMGILDWLFLGSRIGRLGGRFVLKYEDILAS